MDSVDTATPDARMPSIFLSHGAPILADDEMWTMLDHMESLGT